MGDFDLLPPPMPGERKEEKKGFLGKLFGKKSTDAPTEIKAPAPIVQPTPNLDDIKKKLGIVDDKVPLEDISQPPSEQPTPSVELPEIKPITSIDSKDAVRSTQKVEINDWTQDSNPISNIEPVEKSTIWTDEKVLPVVSDSIEKSIVFVAEDKPKLPAKSETTNEDSASKPLQAIDASPNQDVQIPAHHALIEQHLAELDRKHEQITKKLEKIDKETPKLPEWKLQDKEITPDQYFILRNGQPIKSLVELTDALEYIDDITFEHHVNDYRNDFSNWVRDIIKDEDLAGKLRSASDRSDMVKILLAKQREKSKTVIKEHEQIQKTIEKRKEAVSELLGTEKQIAELQQKLAQKTAELDSEKKKYSGLIKKKLDEEVEKKLREERDELKRATASMQAESRELKKKIAELAPKQQELAEHEKKLLLEDVRIKKEQSELQESKKELAPLLDKTAEIRKELEQNKKLVARNEAALKEISAKEASISRKEEAISAKEKKISSDLTRMHELEARLVVKKAEAAEERAKLQKELADAKKTIEESKARREDALLIERSSRERILSEQKKLEALKAEIEKTLSKTKSTKDKITKAVELRKAYESSASNAKKEIVQEREELENDAYKSMIEEKAITTPAGQPPVVETKEVLKIKHMQVYEKIAACKRALETKDLESAKRLYNELRDEYSRADLGPNERDILYNDIRELYDDIHLMMLG